MAECTGGCNRAARDAVGLGHVTKALPTWLQKGAGRNPSTGLEGTCKKHRDRSFHACKIIIKDFQNTKIPLLKTSSLAPESHAVNPEKDSGIASTEWVHGLHFGGSASVCICAVDNCHLFPVTGNYVLKDSVKSISGPPVSGLYIASYRQLPGNMLMYFYITSCI